MWTSFVLVIISLLQTYIMVWDLLFKIWDISMNLIKRVLYIYIMNLIQKILSIELHLTEKPFSFWFRYYIFNIHYHIVLY